MDCVDEVVRGDNDAPSEAERTYVFCAVRFCIRGQNTAAERLLRAKCRVVDPEGITLFTKLTYRCMLLLVPVFRNPDSANVLLLPKPLTTKPLVSAEI
jgi:hypothetical protein